MLQKQRAVEMAPSNGVPVREEGEFTLENTDRAKDICAACYKKQRAVEMAPSNGCALCERKESSRWHKNTDTGEEIFVMRCNQRAIGMAPPNGCALCERKESSQWHKIQTGERDICAAYTKTTCCRNGTIERCALCERRVHNGTKIQRREIFVKFYQKQRAIGMAPPNELCSV